MLQFNIVQVISKELIITDELKSAKGFLKDVFSIFTIFSLREVDI